MTVDYCVSIERHSIRGVTCCDSGLLRVYRDTVRGVTCCDSGLLCVYRETQYKRSYML